MLQSAIANLHESKENFLVYLRLTAFLSAFVLIASLGASAFGQEPAKPENEKKEEQKPAPLISAKDAAKNPTAEMVAESSIFIYGLGGGRVVLDRIRKTAHERGKITIANAEGQMEQANYARWTQRAPKLDAEKVRLDQEFPSARYSLVFNDSKIYGIFNDSVFTPREDASKAFENQIVHGVEALLRDKEDESTIALAGKEKELGVEYYLLDVTDKQSRKTRFFISAKTFRVMMLDYEASGVKYRRKYYDYNYAQGTLVPYRSVLWADGKIVEETEIGTVTYGQKIDEALFSMG